MSQWSTLNKGVTASVKDAVELQIERLLETYQSTLKLQQKGQIQLARQKYEELVFNELIKKEPNLRKKTGSNKDNVDLVDESPLSTLRFLVFKNYATILKDEFLSDPAAEELATKAIDNYLQAVKIDPSDHSLWYFIGRLSQALKKFRFARLAYETGFYISSDERILKLPSVQPNEAVEIVNNNKFSPLQWKCLEGLCEILYTIGDYRLCEFYVNIALKKHSTWEKGLNLKSELDSSAKTKLACVEDQNTSDMDICQPEPISINLKKPDWLDLMKLLLKEYKSQVSTDKTKNKENDKVLKSTSFISAPIEITIEEEENEEMKTPEEVQQEYKKELSNELDRDADQTEEIPEKKQNTTTVLSNEADRTSSNFTTTTPQLPEDLSIAEVIKPKAVVDLVLNNSKGTGVSTPTNTDSADLDTNTDMNSTDPKDSTEGALKRKREDEDDEPSKDNASENENDENDEDEAEEKRLSLRASKRQRDKIANEESSRIKMLDEEKEFVEKIQSFYDSMKHIPKLNREVIPWYDLSNKSSSTFLDWFDTKMSELDSSYCWDIDITKNFKSLKPLNNNSGKQTLTLFVQTQNEPTGVIENKSEIKKIISEINNCNSGVIDTLCKLLFITINNDLSNTTGNNTQTISDEFLQLIIDIVSSLELNIVEEIMSNDFFDTVDKVKIVLRISEYFVDMLIRNTIKSLEESATTTTTNSRRKTSSSLARQSRQKQIDSLISRSTFWITLVEQNLFSLSIHRFNSHINEYSSSNVESGSMSQTEELKIQLRYYSLQGKLEQCKNNIVSSYSWFEKCKLILDNTTENIEINLRSMYDSLISKATVVRKLNLLQLGKLYVAAKEKTSLNDFEGVINDLEDVIGPKMHEMDKTVYSEEDLQMINILSSAYFKSKRYLDSWNCYTRLFSCLVRKLLTYGEEQMQLSKRPFKNDDVEFFSIMSHINDVMTNLAILIQEKSCEEWIPSTIDPELTDALVVLLRMSTYYIFRHPDFIPLVNNFTLPDIAPHTPSKTTKSNGFNDILVKSWVIHSYLIQSILKEVNEPNYDAIMLNWAELLQELHDELGEREICCASKSVFLHHLLDTLIKVDSKKFRREIYQCYHCLYEVHLAAESDVIEEHHCNHSQLDQEACGPLFNLVVNQVVQKLKSGTLLKNDLKDVIETVSDLFEELPVQDTVVNHNKVVIKEYLNSDITLLPSFNMMLRNAIIPTRDIDPKKSKISVVLYNIFWIRGKTLRIQIKNRAKLNNEKNMADLEKAIEEFTSHVTLNPEDADSWNELGVCYQSLAEEELNWSALNIAKHKDLISEYQRKSFHAYMRGIQLNNSTPKRKEKSELFFNFSNLIYSIASSPMNMDSFSNQNGKKIMGSDGKIVDYQGQIPSAKAAYKLAVIMYNHSLQYSTDRFEWRYHYMTGKCLTKIGRPPFEVLDWYLQAIRRVKLKDSKADSTLEPIYVFCSALVKYLYEGKIDAKLVQEYLEKEKKINEPHITDNSDQEVIYLGTNESNAETRLANTQLLNDLNQSTQYLPKDVADAYNAIFQRITNIRSLDSKGLHHRPVYRISWMYYNIYKNTERAKQEIIKLFTLKPTIKNHISIWKPGFELPGKHYQYINKYTLFLIEISKESKDTQTLKYLYRKLRRSQTLIIEDKEVFRLAYTTYLEIVTEELKAKYDVLNIIETVKTSRLGKEKFEAICSSYIKSVTDDKSLMDSQLYGIAQDLSEIRRLCQGHILPVDTEKDGLNDMIQMCFAAAMFGGSEKTEKLNELTSSVDTFTAENNGEASRVNKLLDTMLAQAKIFIQSISTTSR